MTAWGTGPNGRVSVRGVGSEVEATFGGAPVAGLVLGVAFRVWSGGGTFDGGPTVRATYMQAGQTTTKLLDQASLAAFEIGALLDWYPRPTGGWHVGLSAGVGGFTITDGADNSSTSTALTGALFGGYQFWVAGGLSAGLSAVVSTAFKASPTDSAGNATGYDLQWLAVGLQGAIAFH